MEYKKQSLLHLGAVDTIVLITAPSGAGKTSIVKHLLKRVKDAEFSVSAASRSPRDGEIHGKDYWFMNEAQFKTKIENDEFVEFEEVYPGSFYGTLKAEFKRIFGSNHFPVLDVDVKGAMRVQDLYPSNTISIFIDVPSVEILEERLRKRPDMQNVPEEKIKERLKRAEEERTFKKYFDNSVMNKLLDVAQFEVETMVKNFINPPVKVSTL